MEPLPVRVNVKDASEFFRRYPARKKTADKPVCLAAALI